MKHETTIPFAGFYYSIHSDELDHALESIFSDSNGNPINSLVEKAYNKIDWDIAHNLYAKAYVEGLAHELSLKTLTFKLISSPKYYNFTTDRVFCEIDDTEVKEIFEKIDIVALEKAIKQNFTSRDGFISHYSNNIHKWPENISEWDHNQIGTLLEAYIKQTLDNTLDQFAEYEIANGGHYELAYHCIDAALHDCDRLFKIADYLRHREERAYGA